MRSLYERANQGVDRKFFCEIFMITRYTTQRSVSWETKRIETRKLLNVGGGTRTHKEFLPDDLKSSASPIAPRPLMSTFRQKNGGESK